MAKRFSLGFSLFLVISDVVLVVAALFLSEQARIHLPFGREAPLSQFDLPLPVYVMAPAIWLITFVIANVYDPKHTARLVNELQTIMPAAFFAWLVLIGALYLSFRAVSRLQMVYFLVFAVGLILAQRIAVRGYFRLAGGRSYDARRVLIIGTGGIAQDIAQMVQSYAWAGLYLAGFIGDGEGDAPAAPVDQTKLDAPLLGTVDQTADIVRDQQISEVVIALPSQSQLDVRQLVYELQWLPINIRVVPDYFDLAYLHLQVEDFGGMPLLSLKEPTLTPFQRIVKRVFDVMLTLAGMVVALPVMGAIALAIKLDSPGPVLFKQPRIGEGGRVFTIFKFRTMTEDAEQRQDEVIQYDEHGNIIHKQEDDPRITHMGHWLRRTSLDELPQLFNILRGEMSWVGPRPEMPWLVEKYEMWQRKRFEVPQGLTGWWQISGRADKPMHMHTEEDLFYIRNYSLWLDLQILWRTIGVVITRRGAY